MNKKTIRDIDVKGKKVFVRVDFNVPMDENQNITNDTRIRATLPTIQHLLNAGAAGILAVPGRRPAPSARPRLHRTPRSRDRRRPPPSP